MREESDDCSRGSITPMTRTKERVDRTLVEKASSSRVSTLQRRLECLEQDWEAQQASFMVRGKNNHHIATLADTIIRATFTVFVAYAWFHDARSIDEVLSPVGILGVLVFGVCLVGTASTDLKALGYVRAKEAMVRERAGLLEELEAAGPRR